MLQNPKVFIFLSLLLSFGCYSDLYAKKVTNSVQIYAWKSIQNIQSLTLSISYNTQNVNIISQLSPIGEVIQLWNNDDLQTFMINFPKNTFIQEWDSLIEILTKKNKNTSEQMNIINANFSDQSWEVFHLTTSGITF